MLRENAQNFLAEPTKLRNECERTKGNFYSYGINIHACIYTAYIYNTMEYIPIHIHPSHSSGKLQLVCGKFFSLLLSPQKKSEQKGVRELSY